MAEELQLRVSGDTGLPTLVYLPGLHGDWTLIGSFHRALGNRARFVEITYPRTLTWSLEDYAAGVESALRDRGIPGGWVLAESFGSQVAWPIAARKQFPMEGLILAGGFVRHPVRAGVRAAAWIVGAVPLSVFIRFMFGYATLIRTRQSRVPENAGVIPEFIARRTEPDRQAMKHRLHLIARSDFRAVARGIDIPVFAMTGGLDPIVPWISVRRWLRRQCPALREYRVYRRADHNILSTAAAPAADQVVQWIQQERARRGEHKHVVHP